MSGAPTAIWWIRRDLRLTDNQALAAALDHATQVIPLFILDPALLNSPYSNANRIAFLFDGLRSLDTDLQKQGSRLLVRQGDPAQVLAQVMQESGATALFAERDHSPYARQRDETIQADLPLTLVDGVAGLPVGSVEKQGGGAYVVYTPYKRAWLQQPLPEKPDIWQPPERIPTPMTLTGAPIPQEPRLADSVPFPAGEAEAVRRLKAFAIGPNAPIYRYDAQRDRPDLNGTSQLSPYLRFGMISPARAIVAARYAIHHAGDKGGRESAQTWLSELIWRDFYINVLHAFPHVRGQSFREEYDRIQWRQDEAGFQAWCEGRTGYPFVDAAMRQLQQSGWMHNRARMVVASFLVKDLLIDWRWGERWFMQQLVDGDPAANNGGWQWAAGTGTDAAPYFRIFNPVSQSKRFDPDGAYIRHWVPELAGVPDKFIHEPWTLPPSDQRRARCVIGQDYPGPMVDHKAARERTLAAYGVVKGQT